MTPPPEIQENLVSFENPGGDINNSDLELVGSYVHHHAIVDNYDVRERTLASHADNTPTVFWQRKGAVTSISAPARILRLQALHQRKNRYVPCHDFIAGLDNKLADDASCLTHLSDLDFLRYFNTKYPQSQSWQLWTPPLELQRSVISSLLNEPSTPEYTPVLTEPLPVTGNDGLYSVEEWPSTPYSKPSKTKSQFCNSSLSATDQAPMLLWASQSKPEQWRVPYERLAKRSPLWGPCLLG